MRARTKVNVISTKYVQRNNITVCIIKFRLNCFNSVLNLKDLHKIAKKWTNTSNYRIFEHIFEVKGISKCLEGDAFDETLGKRIAESRAKVKMYRMAEAIYKDVADCIEEYLTYYEELSSNCGVVGYNEGLHVIDLYNDNNNK